MLRYIIRRVLYMIPTILGVIVITFILFNVAGGDPAMLKLGKQATAKSLEEYEIQRGLDKPLFFGGWSKTRAFPETDFGRNAGPWGKVEGVVYTNSPIGCIILPHDRQYAVPMALQLNAKQDYRWRIRCRLKSQAEDSSGLDPSAAGSRPSSLLICDGSNIVKNITITASASWRTIELPLSADTHLSDPNFKIATANSNLEISSMSLQKKAASWYDSQFWFFLKQIATLDFGISAETNQRVSKMILDGILPSLALTVPMFFVGLIVEIVLALVCAFFRNRFVDRFLVVFSVALMSIPYLVWIVVGQYFLGYVVRWFPVWGFESWIYLVLPCCIGVFSGLGSGIRFYRTVMLDEIYKDYVRTAFAKGVTRRGVLFKHVLKNAMIPILTSVVMAIPFLYMGSLLLESFFGIPGLGNLAINALNNSDIDVVRATILVGAAIYVVANLVTDICYTLVDPRVKFK